MLTAEPDTLPFPPLGVAQAPRLERDQPRDRKAPDKPFVSDRILATRIASADRRPASRLAKPADGVLLARANHEHIEKRSDLEQASDVAADSAKHKLPLFLCGNPVGEKQGA